MHESHRPPIRVNVHVSVDVPGYGSVAYTSTPRSEFDDSVSGGRIDVTIPTAGYGTPLAHAAPDPCTNVRSICATGTVSAAACCVLGKVYHGFVDTVETPPLGDANLRCAILDLNLPAPWAFSRTRCNLLPGVDCDTTAQGRPNTLMLWCKFDGDGVYTFKRVFFNAVCADRTDCDAGLTPEPVRAAGFPVLAGAAPPAPKLTGLLHKKTGRFAALPETATFAWDAGQEGWVWAPAEAECGVFTFLPVKDGYLLHSTVADPALVAPRPGGHKKPLHLTFEVALKHGAKKEGFVLDVKE